MCRSFFCIHHHASHSCSRFVTLHGLVWCAGAPRLHGRTIVFTKPFPPTGNPRPYFRPTPLLPLPPEVGPYGPHHFGTSLPWRWTMCPEPAMLPASSWPMRPQPTISSPALKKSNPLWRYETPLRPLLEEMLTNEGGIHRAGQIHGNELQNPR